jgi:hypothetical protein
MLVQQAKLRRQVELLLTQGARFVEQVQSEVRVGQVEPRANGQWHVSQILEDVDRLTQQVDSFSATALAKGQVAKVHVDARKCRVSAVFGVDRARSGIQRLCLAQTV